MVSPVYCTACGAANSTQATLCFACAKPLQATSTPTHSSTDGLLSSQALLQQRYRILAKVGTGGFGTVYKAADTKLGERLVAVKEMSQSGFNLQEVSEATEAFKREALLLANLMHPNLPRIYDHFSEAGHWYLTMDFIEGKTLEDLLTKTRNGTGIPLHETLNIGIQLCNVLGYLHTRQPPIIFRDLKPANIMVTSDGNIYLIDFGIARHFKPGQAKDTIAFGSPGYAAPEQYGKAQTTSRADIYSLGATLHQLLTGNDPSDTPFSFAPLPLHIPELEQLIFQMLNMDANKRPASVAEIKQELQRIAAQSNTSRSTQGTRSTPQPGNVGVHAAILSNPILAGAGPITVLGTPLVKYSHHRDKIRSVVWSPDGTRIASASDDGTVQTWKGATGKHISTYQGYSSMINALAWSPKGNRIAFASNGRTVRVWDTSTGTLITTYLGHQTFWRSGSVNAVTWSPDGTFIASAGDDKAIQVWDANTGSKQLSYSGHAHEAWAIAWSPNSTHIASGSYATKAGEAAIHVWDAASGQKMPTYFDYRGDVWALAWSPDGYLSPRQGSRFVSVGSDAKVQVWDASTGKAILSYSGHHGTVWTVAWSPDGTRIASGGSDATVQIWDAKTSKTLFTYQGHSGTAWNVNPVVHTVAWSPDGKYIASGGSDNTVVQVWQAV